MCACKVRFLLRCTYINVYTNSKSPVRTTTTMKQEKMTVPIFHVSHCSSIDTNEYFHVIATYFGILHEDSYQPWLWFTVDGSVSEDIDWWCDLPCRRSMLQ